uniref:Tachylectin 2 domain-containing protein n=1 Tax=Leptobrachium leishanense TaxID=445787 RepID=A0A8C5QRP6_9ANUR
MGDIPDTVLFVVARNAFLAGVGLPPTNEEDKFLFRANPVGKLKNAAKIFFSPGGELFIVRGGDVFKGHVPVPEGQEWFDVAKKVGKVEWGNFKFLLFNPKGILYAVTNNGDFYEGPAPTNENMSWLCQQAKKIGTGNWDSLRALFFDPEGLLYAVRSDGKLVQRSPPTCPEEDWLNTAAQVGKDSWGHLTDFIAFTPKGELWCVNNLTGRLFKWAPATKSQPDFPHDDAMPMGQGYAACLFMAFTTDKTIRSIEHFEFLPESGKIVSRISEVLDSETYVSRSDRTLVHSFSFSREVSAFSSFSQDHGFIMQPGAEITFDAGIPCIDKAADQVSIDGTIRTWSFTKFNEVKVMLCSRSLQGTLSCGPFFFSSNLKYGRLWLHPAHQTGCNRALLSTNDSICDVCHIELAL